MERGVGEGGGFRGGGEWGWIVMAFWEHEGWMMGMEGMHMDMMITWCSTLMEVYCIITLSSCTDNSTSPTPIFATRLFVKHARSQR